ncbi:uncharacterized protein LOC123558921 [Mercenaria mercenaria]|uniref:uncharacterized protein LOC123558921 n=1 Tax=Mercenaria mercenaria TaxID=6596 RepID=UPI00234ED64C|nr:uncharacterized protein LOC123558921 [Mercenaria mercenaria]
MDNATSGDMDSNTTSDNFGPLLFVLNYSTLFVSIVIIFCEIAAVFILQRCKRMLPSSRILSTSFILSDAAGAFLFAIHQILILVCGINNDVTHNSRILAVGTMLTVSWASVASMSLERVIALKVNIKYNINASKLKIYLLVSFIWMANVLIVTVAFLLGFQHHCSSALGICDLWKASKAGRFAMMSLLIFYEIILVVSYVIIHNIASRHEKNILAPKRTFGQSKSNPETLTQRQYAATVTILKIVLAFMLLHAPIVIHLFVFESQVSLRNETLRRIFHALSYLCIQINSFVSVHLYVAKFDECKLYFYLTLSRIFKNYGDQAEELRVKVYDIVLSTKTEQVRMQSQLPEVSVCTSVNDVSTTVS